MASSSILYYTSNHESPEFEKKIQANISKNCNGLSIISVSQKPMDFGSNICIGNVGHSYLNEFRQILIGAKAATTDYLIFAEADFLYSPEYFSFEPNGENIYRYDNIWMLFSYKPNKYFRKEYSIGAQICKREFIIKELEKYLDGQPKWSSSPIRINKPDYNGVPFTYFSGKNPCISFKTGNGMTPRTIVMNSRGSRARTLPYWGESIRLYNNYLK